MRAEVSASGIGGQTSLFSLVDNDGNERRGNNKRIATKAFEFCSERHQFGTSASLKMFPKNNRLFSTKGKSWLGQSGCYPIFGIQRVKKRRFFCLVEVVGNEHVTFKAMFLALPLLSSDKVFFLTRRMCQPLPAYVVGACRF